MILDKNFWSEITFSLKKNKMRTFLTAFGVFWGIFMLIIMYGAGSGFSNSFHKSFEGMAVNSAFMWSQPTGEPYGGFKRGRRWRLTNDDMTYIRNSVSEIETLVPRIEGWNKGKGDNTSFGNKSGTFNLKGDYPDFQKVDPIEIFYGRFINNYDIIEKRKVCMIGSHVRDVLFGADANPVGQFIKIYGCYYQVIGVFGPKTSVNFGGDKKDAIYMPFTTLQVAFNIGNEVHYFAFTAKKGVTVSTIEDKVIKALQLRHNISPNDIDAVGHFNFEKLFTRINSLFIGINLLTWIVGLGTLFAGVIGVSNIMLVIVKERTHEIGINRAIGATPRHIIMQIIAESVVLTTFAGYAGLSLSIGLLEGINWLFRMMPSSDFKIVFDVSLPIGLITLTILVVSGAMAGVLPAYRAVKMKAIDALREEI